MEIPSVGYAKIFPSLLHGNAASAVSILQGKNWEDMKSAFVFHFAVDIKAAVTGLMTLKGIKDVGSSTNEFTPKAAELQTEITADK